MYRFLLSAIVFSLLGCSSPQQTTEEGFTTHLPEYADDEKNDDEAEEDIDATLASATKQGEPVYSTSLAISLAEVALKRDGIDYRDRGVTVSYMDGVYTVIFEKPLSETMGCDFKVDIDAQTSRILKVVTKSE